MRKLRHFFQVIVWCVTDPAYYYVILRRAFRFSVLFFVATLLLGSALATASWRFLVWPTLLQAAQTEPAKLLSQLPADAVFTYENGKLSTQKLSLPFVIKSTPALEDMGFPQNVVTISGEERPMNSALTLTPTTLYIKFFSEDPDAAKYADVIDASQFSVRREQINGFVTTKVQEFAAALPTILIAYFFASFITAAFSGIIMVLLFALIVQSLAWVIGLRLRYRETFQWGLHMYPIALCVDQLSAMLSPKNHFSLVNIAYFGLSLVVLWYGYSRRRSFQIK